MVEDSRGPESLLSIQNWMSGVILSGTVSQDVDRYITASDERSSGARLRTYCEDYWARCIESLAEDFPLTKTYLEARWRDVATDYLVNCPSERFTLYYLGSRLTRFFATHPEYKADTRLLDLARLDWARHWATICRNYTPIRLDAAQTPDRFASQVLYLQPGCSFLEFSTPVHELDPEIEGRGRGLMVFSNQSDAMAVSVDPESRYFWTLFANGNSISNAFDLIQFQFGDYAGEILSVVPSWISQGVQWGWFYSPELATQNV
ncbi:DUF2063 domain-containing protein [bacterium]|nr:DUF2063 domain-containing protein [bacterium]